MHGNIIKVSPVLEEIGINASLFQSYFPKGKWVSLVNFSSIIESNGEFVSLSANQSKV